MVIQTLARACMVDDQIVLSFMLVLIVQSTPLIAYLIGVHALGETGTRRTGDIYVIKTHECDVTDEGQTTKLFVSAGAPPE